MSNPVVLVTGASTGFGRLIAETLARKGYRVAATMRNINGRNAVAAAELGELADMESLWLHALELDVTDERSIERAVTDLVNETGCIDVLVNNAGYGVVGMTEAFTTDQAQRIMDTNFMGVVRMNRAVVPHMRARRSGLVVHISSGAGRIAVPGMGLYCASKWAMEALAETYRYELASTGVDSVIIEPGAYPTSVFGNIERPDDLQRQEAYGEAGMMGERVFDALSASTANAQEIADAVLHTIEMPFGTRPLRQRIGGTDVGIPAMNKLSDEVQATVLGAFGLTALTVATAPRT